MECRAIILDLDDTIFEIKTIQKESVQPFLNCLSAGLSESFTRQKVEMILNELWLNTWNKVIEKYEIDRTIFAQAINVLDNSDVVLNIFPYPDYAFLKSLQVSKFLVTASSTAIQEKKIKALKIENDFEKIIINDPFKSKKTKRHAFEELMQEYNLIPEKTIVIGDNSDSEIKAGNELNMVTVQILREDVKKGNNAKHFIHSFEELNLIINI
ncbi:MAG: HAD family hydrolase [Saprospiraceae bacterium]